MLTCTTSLFDFCRRQPKHKPGPMTILQDLVEDQEEKGLAPHVSLIGQLFSFIGSDPEKAVSLH